MEKVELRQRVAEKWKHYLLWTREKEPPIPLLLPYPTLPHITVEKSALDLLDVSAHL